MSAKSRVSAASALAASAARRPVGSVTLMVRLALSTATEAATARDSTPGRSPTAGATRFTVAREVT